MSTDLLISAEQLDGLIADEACVVFDCRFDLAHPGSGRNTWCSAHIPGAVYAHLDDNLAGRVTPRTGRHPLPNTRAFASFLARAGWSPGRRIVAYDASGGAFAARLWWLMKYFGHDCVALLDGGIQAWWRARLPLESGPVEPACKALPSLHADPGAVLDTRGVAESLDRDEIVLVDARDADRFAGRAEPLDAVAGHIPGAVNHPFKANLGPDMRFRAPAELRRAFTALLSEGEAERMVHMCGSGVTACHNLFAMELAGLQDGRLYPGSWSQWITDPARPVAGGPA